MGEADPAAAWRLSGADNAESMIIGPHPHGALGVVAVPVFRSAPRCERAPDWSLTVVLGGRSTMTAGVRRLLASALLYSTAVRSELANPLTRRHGHCVRVGRGKTGRELLTCATRPSRYSGSPGTPASPLPAAITAATPPAPWPPSDSARHDRNGHHATMPGPCPLAARSSISWIRIAYRLRNA